MENTDAAGVVFFAQLFCMAHQCYEAFLESNDTSLGELLNEMSIPIVHSSADYFRPMTLSDEIYVELEITNIGNSSFEMAYSFNTKNRETYAKCKIIHTVLNTDTKKPITIPDKLKNILLTESK